MPVIPAVPRIKGVDNTIPLLREGYTFISSRCDAIGSDIFQTRLMLKEAICTRGAAAAEMFYHQGRFTRQGALPPTVVHLLQDLGSVQMQDGAAHQDRKAMFVAMMTPEQLDRLVEIADDVWHRYLSEWKHRDAIVLFDQVREILCRIACSWAGVPLTAAELGARTRELGAMIEYAGSAGPGNWIAQLIRQRAERWARNIIERTRCGEIRPPDGSALSIITNHRDAAGRQLDTNIAAVELINILRPTVAVSRFIVFEALALFHHPDSGELVRHGNDPEVELFVQEVRRYYPFFPLIGGRAREPFEWNEYRFAKDTWVLLDLYGTDHDKRIWSDPELFRPGRFREWNGSAYNFIPQGAGDHQITHRCPGEWATIRLMKQAAMFLATEMRYDVPSQDLTIPLSKMPTRPKSGFVMRNVRGVA